MVPKGKRQIKKKVVEIPEPLTASLDEYDRIIASTDDSGRSSTRSNTAASITRTGRYANIEAGAAPFLYTKSGKYSSNISPQDQIFLCQKAYWNVPIFRNTIDLMTEFSMSPIMFTGGNKESLNFFNTWAKKIDLWTLTDMFFREYFRSGNVFCYKLYGEFPREALRKLSEVNIAEAAMAKVPLRYVILNPYDIQVLAASSFTTPIFKKRLNAFELGALLNPQTPEDKQIAATIPELQKMKDKGNNSTIEIELAPDRLISVFYKKQDYEPLSVPMGFPVLEDINHKLELRKMDMALARTIQQVVLLITQGSVETGPPTPKSQEALRKIFENGSVGRVLIADFTTEAKFVIPEIGQILDPKKYDIVDRDIRLGLNNIIFGDDKFAATSVKMDAFFKRLEFARQEFMLKFLIPQVEEISKLMNFKVAPTVKWKSKNFKDNSAILSRVYTRLLELGAISPQDAIHAIEDNRLPDDVELTESQQLLVEDKKKGFYQPMLNNGKVDANGRPIGTGTPQTTQKITPKGQKSVASYQFGVQAIANALHEKENLESQVCAALRKKYKVRKLDASQKQIATDLTNVIIGSEEMGNWVGSIEKYMENPIFDISENAVANEVFNIAAHHEVDVNEAAILYHARKK